MPTVKHKRGTRAALNALRDAGTLVPWQIYALTDESGRLAIATAVGAYTAFVRDTEDVKNWPYLEIAKNGFQPEDTQGFFPTINFKREAADVDTAGGWNTNDDQGNASYNIMQEGVYDCLLKFRLVDGSTYPLSYGVGVDKQNGDSPNFSWFQTNANRNGAIYRRVSKFVVGDKLRAFCYIDGNATLQSAALTIMRVR